MATTSGAGQFVTALSTGLGMQLQNLNLNLNPNLNLNLTLTLTLTLTPNLNQNWSWIWIESSRGSWAKVSLVSLVSIVCSLFFDLYRVSSLLSGDGLALILLFPFYPARLPSFNV